MHHFMWIYKDIMKAGLFKAVLGGGEEVTPLASSRTEYQTDISFHQFHLFPPHFVSPSVSSHLEKFYLYDANPPLAGTGSGESAGLPHLGADDGAGAGAGVMMMMMMMMMEMEMVIMS